MDDEAILMIMSHILILDIQLVFRGPPEGSQAEKKPCQSGILLQLFGLRP